MLQIKATALNFDACPTLRLSPASLVHYTHQNVDMRALLNVSFHLQLLTYNQVISWDSKQDLSDKFTMPNCCSGNFFSTYDSRNVSYHVKGKKAPYLETCKGKTSTILLDISSTSLSCHISTSLS